MELCLIRKDKLKVCLTPFDMVRYDLTCEKLDYENTETRRAVWSILDFAKHETGFDAADGKIRIQAYPERNGGCELFITKLPEAELPSGNEMTASKELPPTVKEVCAVYRFDDADALVSACHFLSACGYTARSEAFSEEIAGRFRYYLRILEAPPDKKTRYLPEHPVLGEYGIRLPNEVVTPYLCEHCEPLCRKNAVKTLAALARRSAEK